jgi:thiol-disulfide isomerase/thioredoxin
MARPPVQKRAHGRSLDAVHAWLPVVAGSVLVGLLGVGKRAPPDLLLPAPFLEAAGLATSLSLLFSLPVLWRAGAHRRAFSGAVAALLVVTYAGAAGHVLPDMIRAAQTDGTSPAAWALHEQLLALGRGRAPTGAALVAADLAALRHLAWGHVTSVLMIAGAFVGVFHPFTPRAPWWLTTSLAITAALAAAAIGHVLASSGATAPWQLVLALPNATLATLWQLVGASGSETSEADAVPARRRSGQATWRVVLASLIVAGTLVGSARVLRTRVPVGRAREITLGATMPELTVTLLDGRLIRLHDLRGRVVVLTFWASWCGPCRSELEDLEALAARHEPDEVTVLATNAGESRKAIESVAGSLAGRVLVASPAPGTWELYPTSPLPRTYLVDREGRLHDAWTGYSESVGRELARQVDDVVD